MMIAKYFAPVSIPATMVRLKLNIKSNFPLVRHINHVYTAA